MGLSNKLTCEVESFSYLLSPHRFFQSEALRLYFPALEPWVVQSVSLPSCSSRFICMQIWDRLLCQPPPHLPQSSSYHLAVSPLHPGCPSPPFLPVRMNVSSLTPWLSDFHTIQFSGSSGCFLFLNLSSFFWLCKEAQCMHLRLHLGWQSPDTYSFWC